MNLFAGLSNSFQSGKEHMVAEKLFQFLKQSGPPEPRALPEESKE